MNDQLTYTWQGQRVTFQRFALDDDQRKTLAWVTLPSGEDVKAPLSELKPLKGDE